MSTVNPSQPELQVPTTNHPSIGQTNNSLSQVRLPYSPASMTLYRIGQTQSPFLTLYWTLYNVPFVALLTVPPLLEGTRSSGVYSIIPRASPYEPHQNTTQSMLQQLIVVECEIVLTI